MRSIHERETERDDRQKDESRLSFISFKRLHSLTDRIQRKLSVENRKEKDGEKEKEVETSPFRSLVLKKKESRNRGESKLSGLIPLIKSRR